MPGTSCARSCDGESRTSAHGGHDGRRTHFASESHRSSSNMSIADQISDIITRITGIPKSRLEPEFDLVESGVVDSIQVLQLLGAIERQFRIVISMDELAELTTIYKISEAIALRTAAITTGNAS